MMSVFRPLVISNKKRRKKQFKVLVIFIHDG